MFAFIPAIVEEICVPALGHAPFWHDEQGMMRLFPHPASRGVGSAPAIKV
jgi:hypothetical protein